MMRYMLIFIDISIYLLFVKRKYPKRSKAASLPARQACIDIRYKVRSGQSVQSVSQPASQSSQSVSQPVSQSVSPLSQSASQSIQSVRQSVSQEVRQSVSQ